MNVALRDKSQFSREAADLCLKQNYYGPSVHCSYYSCVQFMLFILFEKMKITLQNFDEQKGHFRTGTHGCAIKMIGLDLFQRDRAAYKTFQQHIPALKKLREEADYTVKPIPQEESQMALTTSDMLKRLLQNIYR